GRWGARRAARRAGLRRGGAGGLGARGGAHAAPVGRAPRAVRGRPCEVLPPLPKSRPLPARRARGR
ncbi:hypothetical protein, partial [Streptomyces griseus]|uniref:hypothetical protein n=1 Tax=Streptomyces griseus TaxID=1911 RepID=UPI001C57A656